MTNAAEASAGVPMLSATAFDSAILGTVLTTLAVAVGTLVLVMRDRKLISSSLVQHGDALVGLRSRLETSAPNSPPPASEDGLESILEKANRRLEKKLKSAHFAALSRKLETVLEAVEECSRSRDTDVPLVTESAGTLPRAMWPKGFRTGKESLTLRRRLGALLDLPECPVPIVSLVEALLSIGRLERQNEIVPIVWANELQTFSAAAYAASAAMAERCASEDDSFDVAAFLFDQDGVWSREANALIETRNLPLSTRAILPGDPFESDVMECAPSDLGKGAVVKRPWAWIIFEVEETSSRLLLRGQVETK